MAPADLFNKTWVVPPSDTLVRQHVDTYFASAFGTTPKSLIESDSLLGSLALLSLSDSVGVMAKRLADFFAGEGVLRTLPLEIGDFIRPVALITLRAQVLKPQLEYLVKLLRAQAPRSANGPLSAAVK
ncbi:LysR substrate-binding domain-containing protein [Polaromonas sp. P1-6]|nr:LysR substrate-binding domain-containing protein [Polaromonas sp. P1-6]